MMQQGLGALMPQQPAGQAPENPVRMAAAMDVVTSDAEEQVLDPRTLALIKYKDAVAAMQAADQLMAASQPTPTPPTVAERTKLAAQQGIMGLASRLAPGLQQQGSRMGAAQAQQAMTGGLAQLPAPNMAGMAGGGIVGYAEGGTADADVQRYTAQYRAIMAAVQNAGTPEQKAQLQQRLREIQSTFDPETIARAHMQMSGQGMAAGGEVQGFQNGGLPTAGGRDEDEVVTYDELGNPIYASDIARALAAGTTDTSEEGAARRAAYAALQAERPDLSELARTPERPSASTERVPTTGYGMGDRTGQGEALAGMGQGVAGGIRDGLGSLVPRGLSDEEIAAETAVTRRGAPRETGSTDTRARTTSALDSAYLSGLGGSGSSSPVNMGRDLVSALDRFKTAMGYTEPRAAERAEKEAQILAQYEDVARAQQERVAARQARRPEEQGSGLDAMYAMGLGGSSRPAGITPTAPAAASESDAVATTATTPAPAPAAAPAAVSTAPAATTQDAVETLLNQSPPTKTTAGAGQSRDSRDERLRRVIAGLRGLGAEGVGGYAAGSAGEEQRLEQELIAGQERQRTAGMEERELGLRDREVTLMDQLRRDQMAQDLSERQQAHELRVSQLGADKQEFLEEQVAERTESVRNMINMLETSILTGDDSVEKRNQLLALQDQELRIREEVEASLAGYMGAGAPSAAGAGGFNANDFTVRTVTP